MTTNTLDTLVSLWPSASASNWAVTANCAAGAERIFPIVDELGTDTSKRLCREALDHFWNSWILNPIDAESAAKWSTSVRALPEATEQDSNKPGYYVSLAVSVVWDALQSLSSTETRKILKSSISGMLGVSADLDYLVRKYTNQAGRLREQEVANQERIFELIGNQPPIPDPSLVLAVKELSLAASDFYRDSIQKIARAKNW
jgi:hypothetical protein